MLTILVSLLLFASAALCENTDSDCSVYEHYELSRPDFAHNMIANKVVMSPGYSIVSVVPLKKERSFYWCEMTMINLRGIQETKRRFGHNDTHWWVKEGCGDFFNITVCKNNGQNHQHSNTHSNKVNPAVPATPKPGRGSFAGSDHETSHPDRSAVADMGDWMNEPKSIQMKLGSEPSSRVARSVDEEFEYEFNSI